MFNYDLHVWGGGELHGPFPIFTVASLNFGLSIKGLSGAIRQCSIMFGVEKVIFLFWLLVVERFGSLQLTLDPLHLVFLHFFFPLVVSLSCNL